MSEIEIRPIVDAAGCTAVEQLQVDAWQMADNLEVVPSHMLLTFHKNGGVLLGAYRGKRLVGFVAGFVGIAENGRFKHASHMMGIHPQFQGQGIGFQLKLAQRQSVRQQGLDLITWTYDPLEAGNAKLNIHKLGATCNAYIPNLYGEFEGINAGLPTDRFLVNWQINSGRVEDRIAGKRARTAQLAAHLILNPLGERSRPSEKTVMPFESSHFVQIPLNFQAIKAQDLGLALAWRHHTRSLFTNLFYQNYSVSEFMVHRGSAFYQLDHLDQNG